jgi:eukaryotic-like serine/threonine-protein kinase
MSSADGKTTKKRRSQKTSEAGLRFLQQRVALFGLVGFGLGGIFLAFRVVMTLLEGDARLLLDPSMTLHLVGACALLMSWAVCRGGPLNKRLVENVEAVSLVVSAIAYSAMGLFIPAFVRPELVVVLAMTMGLMARAVFVPSTAKRTGILAGVVGVPVIFVAFYAHASADTAAAIAMNQQYPPAAAAVSAAVWWLLSSTLATVASHVIYGLRKEIRQARRLGQYALEQKLGEGGMGVVYRASHAMLRRPTAIKLLPANKAGENAIARFEREVRLTARLTHPNTVTVFDYGRTPDGIFYYAMELLEGATLEEIVEHEGAQPAARVVHVLAATAGALAEAHDIGLIHRDIKPANVMLCRRGREVDVPKLLDFGLVKDLEASHTLSLTSTNTITGTPLYMPPEAIVAPDKVDSRSDIYALAAVGYFMLTGTHVFEGDSVVEVCSRHLQATPDPPSERLGLPVPDDLSEILLDCLAKDPNDRPASASVLQARLLACAAASCWGPSEARAWWNAHEESLLGKQSVRQGPSSDQSIAVDLGRRTDRPQAK